MVRCRTGRAVLTGPDSFGSLQVPYVVHAVGPDYRTCKNATDFATCDGLLRSAYQSSLECVESCPVTHIGVSLLSAGISRGKQVGFFQSFSNLPQQASRFLTALSTIVIL